jgi:hypothetical protein
MWLPGEVVGVETDVEDARVGGVAGDRRVREGRAGDAEGVSGVAGVAVGVAGRVHEVAAGVRRRLRIERVAVTGGGVRWRAGLRPGTLHDPDVAMGGVGLEAAALHGNARLPVSEVRVRVGARRWPRGGRRPSRPCDQRQHDRPDDHESTDQLQPAPAPGRLRTHRSTSSTSSDSTRRKRGPVGFRGPSPLRVASSHGGPGRTG